MPDRRGQLGVVSFFNRFIAAQRRLPHWKKVPSDFVGGRSQRPQPPQTEGIMAFRETLAGLISNQWDDKNLAAPARARDKEATAEKWSDVGPRRAPLR